MSRIGIITKRSVAALVAIAIALPGTALAEVRVDSTVLNQGKNEVGGGTATWQDSTLDMNGVTADKVSTDENLAVTFTGGNDIEHFETTGDANVDVSFEGSNHVEDIEARDQSDLTVNLTGNDDIEDIEAYDNSNLTVNVTGDNECESIKGYDNANVTVQGTTYPTNDKIEFGEGESSERIGTERGKLTIKDVTVIARSKNAGAGSKSGDVDIKCSKIASGDDNERTDIYAGGKMFIGGSVIDIAGTVHSDGMLTIRRSDVDVTKPDGDNYPYRVWSKTGIELIEELNGIVREGKMGDDHVWYLDTGDDDEVHLVSALRPCYYGEDSSGSPVASKLPVTADANVPAFLGMIASGAGVLILSAQKRRNTTKA